MAKLRGVISTIVHTEAPIERSHYERVYETAIALRETSQSRRLQVD
jgi:hypothetical protein